MKVILIKDVATVGKQGEVVNVAEGYARNFLFPRKMAIDASAGNMKNIERQHALEERMLEKRLADAQAVAAKIGGKTVTITGKASAGSTKLFGSITAQDVADALKQLTGVDVDKRKVELAKPIRTVGSYDIPVRLHRSVTATVKVEVVVPAEQA